MFNVAMKTYEWSKQKKLNSFFFEDLESTNSLAKSNLHKETGFPSLYFTEYQSKGRGRGQNTWVSAEKGSSLLTSVSFKLERPPQAITAACFGWAVYKALTETFDFNFNIKAPNDIYIENKKVGGILLEAESLGEEHYLIFGLGLNVFKHPHVDQSAALADFTQAEEQIEENQWLKFFSMLMAHSGQAAVECQETFLSPAINAELQSALENFPGNQIVALEADGSLCLQDGSITNWREL